MDPTATCASPDSNNATGSPPDHALSGATFRDRALGQASRERHRRSHDLGVALHVGAEHHDLEPVLAGRELARDPGRDPDCIETGELDLLVVEMSAAVAPEHEDDLLGLAVPVRERRAAAGLDPQVGEPGV